MGGEGEDYGLIVPFELQLGSVKNNQIIGGHPVIFPKNRGFLGCGDISCTNPADMMIQNNVKETFLSPCIIALSHKDHGILCCIVL